MTDEMRQHIRTLAEFARVECPANRAFDEDADAVLQWLDDTEAAPPKPDAVPVRIVVDVGQPYGTPKRCYAEARIDHPDNPPARRGLCRTIVLANAYTPGPPREIVGTVEKP